MSGLIEARELRKSFGAVLAVDGVSFEIPEGICFGLLGPNGAGKTTTIEIMEGILSPDAGDVLFRGAPIDANFKTKVGIQFQTTALPDYITVKETLQLFSAFYPDPRSLDEVVELCSLGELLRRDNGKLSGGQRQRLLLGIAIIPRPELIFLDEPTTGLDPQARRNFWDLIEKIKAENTTIILTTHYMEEAETLCERIAIMDRGKILEDDNPRELIGKHFTGALVRVPRVNGSMRYDLLPAGSRINGNGLEVVSSDLDTTMRELVDAHLDLEGLSIHKPNLEDLFIKLTGSSLRS